MSEQLYKLNYKIAKLRHEQQRVKINEYKNVLQRKIDYLLSEQRKLKEYLKNEIK